MTNKDILILIHPNHFYEHFTILICKMQMIFGGFSDKQVEEFIEFAWLA